MKCKICSLYICVEDMNRAIKFYEDFLSNRLPNVINYTAYLI